MSNTYSYSMLMRLGLYTSTLCQAGWELHCNQIIMGKDAQLLTSAGTQQYIHCLKGYLHWKKYANGQHKLCWRVSIPDSLRWRRRSSSACMDLCGNCDRGGGQLVLKGVTIKATINRRCKQYKQNQREHTKAISPQPCCKYTLHQKFIYYPGSKWIFDYT